MRSILVVTLRALALAILLTWAVGAATAAHPREAGYEEFVHEVQRGAVDQVLLPNTSSSSSSDETVWMATWSTGPFQWREGPISDRTMLTVGDFSRTMRDQGVDVTRENDDAGLLTWPLRGPAWMSTLLGLTWLAVFLVMLGSRPTYATRWAWFWMFVVGQLGALVYLLLEPAPLWRRATVAEEAEDSAVPVAPRTRWNGLQGFAGSILLLVGGAAAAAGVGWVAARLL